MLPATAQQKHVRAYEDALAAQKQLQEAIQRQASRAQRFQSLRSALEQQQLRLDEEHDKLRRRYEDLALDSTAWEGLRPKIDDTAFNDLGALVRAARDDEKALRERGTTQELSRDAEAAGVAVRAARVEAAQKALGEDEAKSKRRADLVKKLDIIRSREDKALKEHEDAMGAPGRIAAARDARFEAYEQLLHTLDAEVAALNELYEPLRQRLAADERLRLLTFEVSRHVKVDMWVDAGARVLDLRRAPLRGRGELAQAAKRILEPAWRIGTPAEVRAGIEKFQGDYLSEPASLLRQGMTTLELGQWLFSTEHISVRYGIKYDGRDIASLSPGARGVVLLTLFLAIDAHDERPLVIDQPEENLDPKSVNGLLVPFFVEAAQRRQIIMVTHNANLVVNTDADQVIVATSQRSEASELPNFEYVAGGLESSEIRTLVCQYLEGGEEAFRRRAVQYGEIVSRR